MKKRLCIMLIMLIVLSAGAGVGGFLHAQTPARAEITLIFGTKTMTYRDDILPAPDHVVYEQMYERRINAAHREKIAKVEECLKMGAEPKASMLYCYPMLEPVVTKMIEAINAEPVDSRIRFRPYETPMFTISKEKSGFLVTEQRLYYDIYNALRRGEQASVHVRAEELKPARTADEWKACTYRRAVFSTDYRSSNENRKHNIKLAMSKLNGVCVDVGEEFSFNKTVGKRTEANGFVISKIILDGAYVDGTGGGVCQASTTLYNCAIRAGLTITRVQNHSLTPSYVPPSMDAMVNAGSSDLRFKNETGMPVFIRAYGTGERAVAEIYGLKMPYEIRTDSVIVSKVKPPEDKILIDTALEHVTPEMQSGERVRVSYGIEGVMSEGYLLYYKDGKLIDRKLIRKDTYKTAQGIIAEKP